MSAAFLIAAPVITVLCYKHWLDTRIVVPLKMPVLLSKGHQETKDFYINLKGQYVTDVKVDYPLQYSRNCPLEGGQSVLKASVRLFRDKQVIVESQPPQSWIFFNPDREGYYRVSLDILSDASCLDAAHPILSVASTGFDYYTDPYKAALWISVIPIVIGSGLISRVIFAAMHTPADESATALNSERPPSLTGAWRFRFGPVRLFSPLPRLGSSTARSSDSLCS